jgi:hypothetical protein
MRGTTQLLDTVQIELGQSGAPDNLVVYIDVWHNSLAGRWLAALNHLLGQQYHLEKNYCFFGFADGPRSGEYLLDQINLSIQAINSADLGYHITDHFTLENSRDSLDGVDQAHFNQLHRYFEDLQGTAAVPSPYYLAAAADTRWHIRQLNLLCHEFESWQLSWRKQRTAPEWQRPSQLMCWLSAPRFELEPEDLELFGIETINRSLGGVYVGVNKAVGKHHWEVFCDEGRASRIQELTTQTLSSQTLACGDFDIEWARDPGAFPWQKRQLREFRAWLEDNGFDPDDKSLTIGHPQIGQVDLMRSFGTEDYRLIWSQLNTHLNVCSVQTSQTRAVYDYHWWDPDYMQQQIRNMR